MSNVQTKLRITQIPGDGTGPEVSAAMRHVIEATGLPIEWDIQEAGADVMPKHGGNPLPDDVLESIKRNGVGIKGPLTTPVGTGFRSVNVALRQALDLYANVRPVTSLDPKNKFQDVDLVIVRENTEDLYAGIEFEQGTREDQEAIEFLSKLSGKKIRSDAAIGIKPISIFGSRRIVKFAFDYALKNGRKKVTAVHKANIMKYTDGLFLKVAQEVAKEYEGRIAFEDRIVDNMCMQLVIKPELYDVLVLPNLYGDIVSDLGAGLMGGLGLAPGGNIGEHGAVFEPVHGSAPKYAGQNKVNPIATILSGAMMLRYLDKQAEAEKVERAVREVILEGKTLTYDMGGHAGTREVGEAIADRVRSY
ncbi:MAG TPA: isocitrate/isopropylmalate dehydrogenase family protein [Oscillatoriaceae cyanobacterium]